MEIGQVCLKIAGRDAGKECVVIENINDNFVLIDGNTRRRKCNIRHLEPLEVVVDVSEKASHEQILKALKEAGFNVVEEKKGSKNKTKSQKPVQKRKALLKVKELKPSDKKKTEGKKKVEEKK